MSVKKTPWRQNVADEMIRHIEAGTAPWQKPWKAGVLGDKQHNPTNDHAYSGINAMWLEMQGHSDPRWMTLRQANEVGAKVRSGEKSTQVEYWQWTERKPKLDVLGNPVLDENGKKTFSTVQLDRPKVFYANVFNAEQIDGLEPYKAPELSFEPVEEAEKLLAAGGVEIHHDQDDKAFYQPSRDQIHLPQQAAFPDAYEYYSTALHELGHATGHSSRMNRDYGPFGSEVYAKEELRAEMSSYMVARDLGLGHYPDRHAPYVENWLKAIKEDRNVLFQAARDAEQITQWIKEPEMRPALEKNAQSKRKAAKMERTQKAPSQGGKYEPELQEWQDKFKRDLKEISSELLVLNYLSFVSPNRAKFSETPEFDKENSNLALNELEARGITNADLKGLIERVENRENNGLGDVIRQEQQNRQFQEFTASEKPAQETAEELQASQDKDERSLIEDIHRTEIHPLDNGNVLVLGFDDEDLIIFEESHHKSMDAAHERELELTNQRDNKIHLKGPGQKNLWADGYGTKTPEISQRVYLAVPYSEKDQAKAAGAKWDREQKAWFAPSGADLTPLEKWKPDNQPKLDVKTVDPRKEFADELKRVGVEVKGEPVMDGKWHRTRLAEDGKGQRNASYRAFLDGGRPNGQIKNFKIHGEGEYHKWVATGEELSKDQLAALKAEAAQKQHERNQERLELQKEARLKAMKMFDHGQFSADHAYLTAKNVQNHGLLVDAKGKLMIPAKDVNGNLWSVQSIDDKGNKRFQKNGRKFGLMHVIDPHGKLGKAGSMIIVGEGYGTLATVNDATKQPSVVAFDSSNLKAVAEALRKKYPDAEIAIAGDNDHGLENKPYGNIGLKKGQEAAQAVNGLMVAPKFSDEQKAKGLTDWNDLANDKGVAEVTNQIRQQLKQQKRQSRGQERDQAQAVGM